MNVITFVGLIIVGFDMMLLSLGLYVASTMNKWYDLQLQIPIMILIVGFALVFFGTVYHEEVPTIKR